MQGDATATRQSAWWKGSRGEWLVIAQVVLIGLVFFGSRVVDGQPPW